MSGWLPDAWVERLARALLHFLWRGTAIAAVYAAARLWLVAARPGPRYLLGCLALTAMLAVPIATFVHSSVPLPAVARVGQLTPLSLIAPRPGPPLAPVPAMGDGVLVGVVLIWFSGALVLSARFVGGWIMAMRMRSGQTRPAPLEWSERFGRLCVRLGIGGSIKLLVSGQATTPMVVGWLRPVVLVPAGLLAGLPVEYIEALLLHELAHVRRNDYLVNLLQRVIESLLFYHPAVWWISGQVRVEREMWCDDAAVGAGCDELTYARALTELESSRQAIPDLAMAGSGGLLANRIGRLLGVSRPPSPRRVEPSLAIAGVLMICAACGLYGQLNSEQPLPAFDIDTIKPSKPDAGLKIAFLPGDRLVVRHATLQFLIKIAYDLGDDQILGGPAWIRTKRFDLEAKPETAPTDQSNERVKRRLQRLLAERFQLTLRNESKELDLFALIVGKNGPRLTAGQSTATPQFNAGRGRLRATRVTMDRLAGFLSEGQTGRPVVNMTGLNAEFDFELAGVYCEGPVLRKLGEPMCLCL